MKNFRSLTTALCTAFLLIALPFATSAQTHYSTGGAAKIVINGTSNIHDWKMESGKGTCAATFTLDAAGNLTAVSGLSFTMPVTALKSEHGSQMDNNCYKAIGSDKYPNITFSSGSASVAKSGAGFTISAPGKLQISSGSKDVTLVATAKVNPDKSLTITGAYKLVTTDYNVKPISIMLGAIKTSANVSIDYNLVMKPQ